jgi:predicted DNA binding protein/ActR/RegA family two-component response regulator
MTDRRGIEGPTSAGDGGTDRGSGDGHGGDDGGDGGSGGPGGNGRPIRGGHTTVLLVDDDETWARTNARLLGRTDGISVETATTLAAAREAYAALDPDCVVCDYRLERGTGLDLLATVRERDPRRPFVLVTGEGSEAVASDAIGRRVTDYVRKAAIADDVDLLAARIEAAVEARRTERALARERRSKDAMLDILTATSTRNGLARDFCRHLVAERGYALAWLATHAPADGLVPEAAAGREAYLEAAVPPGTGADAADEPALVALREGAPCVVPRIAPDVDGPGPDDGVGSRDRGDGRGNGDGIDDPPGGRPTERDDRSDEGVGVGTGAIGGRDGAGPADWRRLAVATGLASCAAVPVRHDGAVIGVLAVYAAEEGVVDDDERDLLAEYGSTIGFALRTAGWKQSLLSADRVAVDFVVRDGDVPLVALCGELPSGATVSVRTAVFRGESRLLYVAAVDGASRDDVDRAAAAVDSVASVTATKRDESGSEADGRGHYEIVVDGPAPEGLLVDRGARVLGTVVKRTRATVSVVLSGHDAVSELEATLHERYADAAIGALRSDPDVDTTTPLSALTDKQLGALELAYYEGYFERPRRNNATEVAAKLGISRATFSQHLQAAQRKVLARLLENDRRS